MTALTLLKQTIQPYYEFSKNATKNATLSNLIDELTCETNKPQNQVGRLKKNNYNSSFNAVINNFFHECDENIKLENEKEIALANKYLIKHLLNEAECSSPNELAIVDAIDNHISILDNLMGLNAAIAFFKFGTVTSIAASSVGFILSSVDSKYTGITAISSFASAFFIILYSAAEHEKNRVDYTSPIIYPDQISKNKSLKDRLFENLTIFSKFEKKEY